MIGSIHYIWTINQFAAFSAKGGFLVWFAGRNWRGGPGLDEVEMRVSDEGEFVNTVDEYWL
jgi:hypothetical protein